MPMIPIEIEPLIIQISGPLAMKTGFRRGLIQQTVERDAEGFVYIPASSIKGRVRHASEQLAQRVGLDVCQAPQPGGMCSAHKKACLICRVFGAPGRASHLRWHDAHLHDDYRQTFETDLDAQVYARTQVQLSRSLGTAVPNRLFTSEFAIEDLRFESSIAGYLEITPIDGDDSKGGYELLLLLAGLRLVNTIGGGASRGAGRCTITLPDEVKVNGNIVVWQEVLEGLDLLPNFDEEDDNGD